MPREEDSETFEWPAGSGAQGGASHEAPRRFEPAELVACDACLRANAPTRMNCLYCGAPLPADGRGAAMRRPALRKLEEWERGFNVVLHPPASEPAPETLEEVAALLRLEASRLAEIVAAGLALPVARASTGEEAALIVSRLGALGLASEVFADEELARTPPRVRALKLEVGALAFVHGAEGEPARAAWEDLALMVTGRVVERRVEFEERPGKLGVGGARLVEARETAVDEAVLDIYTADEGAAGFRIMADGFDYSCLGEAKALLARENFVRLVGALRARATRAAFDDAYTRLRAPLSAVWPPAERTESGGLRRDRPGRLNTESVTVVSNESQFTRYARLRRRLALRERAKD